MSARSNQMAASPDDSGPLRPAVDEDWLQAFYAGQRACMAECYQKHFDLVDRAVGTVLTSADRETLVHEVFFRLLTDASLRRGYSTGSLRSWLWVVARNQAIDFARRRRHEVLLPADSLPEHDAEAMEDPLEQRMHVRLTLERFRAQVLPPKWERVFQTRFVQQEDQPTAARLLLMSRTTLAYQEYRIRNLLRRFVLKGERS
jgi:RNA polymerase sigma-70 factor (ECF subfamily)